MKQSICLTPSINPIRTNGSGEHTRLTVPMVIHAGPASIGNRPVNLILTPDETLTLAAKLLASLPVMWLSDEVRNDPRVVTVTKFFNTIAR